MKTSCQKEHILPGLRPFFAASRSVSMASVAFSMDRFLRLYPAVLLSKPAVSLIRFFLFFVESRMLLTGIKVLPPDHPKVSILNPKQNLCFAWS